MHRIIVGDAAEALRALPAESAQCCITSPPYFGLRSYGGGEAEIGLEASPDEYVSRLVAVFREVRRVLRPDGVAFLNLGDSYAANAATARGRAGFESHRGSETPTINREYQGRVAYRGGGVKGKDLLGIPWRVAFALQADGWWLRSAIVWAKPCPMPESVKDRPTSAYEHVFLLAKASSYFFDAAAIAEPAVHGERFHGAYAHGGAGERATRRNGRADAANTTRTRNARNVQHWTPRPYKGAHFAVMPQAMAEWCVKAGTSERGGCPHCRAPWQRVVERTAGATEAHARPKHLQSSKSTLSLSGCGSEAWAERGGKARAVGWAPSCACPAHEPVPQVVIDPFGGAGTTAVAARDLGRDAVLIELSAEYAALAEARLADAPKPERRPRRVPAPAEHPSPLAMMA